MCWIEWLCWIPKKPEGFCPGKNEEIFEYGTCCYYKRKKSLLRNTSLKCKAG